MVRVQRQMRRWNHGNFHYPIIYIYIKRNNYRSFVINLQYRGNNFVISRARVMRVLFPLYRNIEMCISCIDYVQLVDNPISLQRDYLANLKRNECVDRYWNFHKKSDSLNIVIFCIILYLLCIISRIFLLMIKETSIFFEYYNTVLFYILLLCIEYIIPFPLPCFNKANCPFAIFFFFISPPHKYVYTSIYTYRFRSRSQRASNNTEERWCPAFATGYRGQSRKLECATRMRVLPSTCPAKRRVS